MAPKAGTSAEVLMLQSAHQTLMRDKNTAFDALDKVCAAKQLELACSVLSAWVLSTVPHDQSTAQMIALPERLT